MEPNKIPPWALLATLRRIENQSKDLCESIQRVVSLLREFIAKEFAETETEEVAHTNGWPP